MRNRPDLVIPSSEPFPLDHRYNLPVLPETRLCRLGGEAGVAGGHLLVVVGAVPGAGGVPPQAPPPVRREPQLPRPRQGLLRRHRGARAFQAVRYTYVALIICNA